MNRPVILITGASSGIGAATAILAAERGYDVALTYRNNRQKAESVAQKIKDLGRKALCVKTDVGVETDVLHLFQQIDIYFGRLDALVNNAAILRQKLFLDIESSELENLFSINVIGSFICAREAIKRMCNNEGDHRGAIVNVSSIAARFGSPFEYIDYAASKGAIDTFTLGLAKEFASKGIRVNAVRPGIINTELHAKGGEPERIHRIAPTVPMQRAGEANEIAKTILWLLSNEASYISGSLVDVSGGR